MTTRRHLVSFIHFPVFSKNLENGLLARYYQSHLNADHTHSTRRSIRIVFYLCQVKLCVHLWTTWSSLTTCVFKISIFYENTQFPFVQKCKHDTVINKAPSTTCTVSVPGKTVMNCVNTSILYYKQITMIIRSCMTLIAISIQLFYCCLQLNANISIVCDRHKENVCNE